MSILSKFLGKKKSGGLDDLGDLPPLPSLDGSDSQPQSTTPTEQQSFSDDLSLGSSSPQSFGQEQQTSHESTPFGRTSTTNNLSPMQESNDGELPSSMMNQQQQTQQYSSQVQSAPLRPQDGHQMHVLQKDVEVLSVKMDALRSTMEAVAQRLAQIERILDQQRRW